MINYRSSMLIDMWKKDPQFSAGSFCFWKVFLFNFLFSDFKTI